MGKETVKPMPFPGESPTVQLAMAAGQRFGLQEKPARAARKGRKAGTKSAAARPAGNASGAKPRRKAGATKPARKPAAAKPAKKAASRKGAGTRSGSR